MCSLIAPVSICPRPDLQCLSLILPWKLAAMTSLKGPGVPARHKKPQAAPSCATWAATHVCCAVPSASSSSLSSVSSSSSPLHIPPHSPAQRQAKRAWPQTPHACMHADLRSRLTGHLGGQRAAGLREQRVREARVRQALAVAKALEEAARLGGAARHAQLRRDGAELVGVDVAAAIVHLPAGGERAWRRSRCQPGGPAP